MSSDVLIVAPGFSPDTITRKNRNVTLAGFGRGDQAAGKA